MIVSNRYNLPQYVVDVLSNDDYDYNKDSISATQMLNGGMYNKLLKEHNKEMVVDASDRLWSIYGNAIHYYNEKTASNVVTELRLFTTIDVDGKEHKITSKADVYVPQKDEQVIADWKNTSKYAIRYNTYKPEWEEQLNINAYIYKDNGLGVKKLQIITFLRDLDRRDMLKSEYPDIPIKVIDIPLWSKEKQENFIKHRIKKIINEEPCDNKERWKREDVYKVIKDGAKRSVKNYANYNDALQDVAMRGPAYTVETFKGEDVKCLRYCAVKNFCKYYQENYGNEVKSNEKRINII